MKIGVLSDTHGNHALMFSAVEKMGRDVDLVYHLGDTYADSEVLGWSGCPVRAVPGLWCPEYRESRVPKVMVDEHDGLRLACAHAAQDVLPRKAGADVVLYGHTHEPMLRKRKEAVWLNPGHLKNSMDRGHPSSFAVIQVLPEVFEVEVCAVAGEVLFRESFPRPAKAEECGA